ncbi:hypothetical protein [Umezawaea sp. Da 62-37]|uniref:NACHT domain-containing protein n=1 Tax=Umezawaea sp. Da 62-37 TaxID=3075927 RepID=UPI0028F70877|nr:hypothetical protein [Umezawaea sp. Da 62-37]WNV84748.1 hypothetical protein RM788_42390 [Umezawaea sp. Da 62-37]
MPESRHKYLYERLGDHDFQLLVNALLTSHFENFVPLPLRQSDGGRDGLQRGAPESGPPVSWLVYQVKWSVDGKHKDPVGWLDTVISGESENLTRLAAEGVRQYTIVTNVPSTGRPGQGTFDRLNAKLDTHAKKYGLEQMTCLWRESIDAMVDNASTEIKWQYADMLAGWDLIRYLISEDTVARKDHGLRALVRKVAAAQWDDDERVKFSQVDIDREKVADLFIDVNAERLHKAGHRRGDTPHPEPLGGAAAHLLQPGPGCILVRGAPGQGKSTLSQYVSQVHRVAFMPARQRPEDLPTVELPLFPLRLDLSDYARWLSGADVWDKDSDTAKKSIKRPASQSTVECFLAELMTHASGGIPVEPKDVQDIFDRVPSIVVLDGLDEVGRPKVREKVVDAIDQFCRRGKNYPAPPRVVVTTRPSANELPEPSSALFDVLVLTPLDIRQRNEYLQKWCAVRGINGTDGRTLRINFRTKSREPYIGELAGNPMQLTILLDLLHKHGEATPTQRTELYDSYVELLLAREANKHPQSVRKHQKQLREIVPFLGWYLQAHSEEAEVNARMSVADLKAAIRHFQRAYGKSETIVDELFEATSDRLWTLTSKNEGTFEFEVLSLREYFAARFLYRYAGEDSRGFDRNTVFRELLRRPYWLNTARFYGGNAEGGDVYVLADGIRDEALDNNTASFVVAAWTLLTDGAFLSRPLKVRDVLTSLCDDRNHGILLDALSRKEIVSLPELPRLPSAEGADPTWTRLTGHLTTDPANHENPRRIRVLRDLLNQKAKFSTWWGEQVRTATDKPSQDAWLRMVADCEGAAGAALDLYDLDLSRPLVAQRVLNTGLVPAPGGRFEADLLQAVLDGRCPNVTSVRSLPAQIAVTFSTDSLLTTSETGFTGDNVDAQRRRKVAVTRLHKVKSPFAGIAVLRRFRPGEKGSTFPWSNTATALFAQAGRCWLASLAAIIGAASPHQLAFTRHTTPADDRANQPTAFGPGAHPTTLLAETRNNYASTQWWRDQLQLLDTLQDPDTRSPLDDALGHAEWALALWCVASNTVISALFTQWQSVFTRLPELRRHGVADAARRIGTHGWLTPLTTTAEPVNEVVAALVKTREPRRRSHRQRSLSAPATSSSSLLAVARTNNWFKVDTIGNYR